MRHVFILVFFLLAAATARALPADSLHECIAAGRFWKPSQGYCMTRTPPAKPREAPLPPGCAWRDHSFVLDEIRRITIAFRYRQCADAVSFRFADDIGALFQTVGGRETRVAQFWDYAPGNLGAMLVHVNRRGLKPEEELDCEAAYIPDFRAYAYRPNAAYLHDLTYHGARDVKACGPYGVDMARLQYFRVLDDRLLVFLSADPNGNGLDPQSLRIAP